MNTSKTINISIYFFLVAFLLLPFYFWKSGTPQISHMIAAMGFLLIVRDTPIKTAFQIDFFKLLGILAAYSIIVNSIAAYAYSDIDPLRYPLYYLFCLIFCLGIYTLISEEQRFLQWLYYILVMSLLIQVVFSFVVLAEPRSRFTILFNNPNQLGYYSLLSLLLITFLNHRLDRPRWLLYLGMAMGLYLGFLSASKGIIWGNFLYILGYALVGLIEKRFSQVIGVILCGILGYATAALAYDVVNPDTIASRSVNKQHTTTKSASPSKWGMITKRIVTTGRERGDDLPSRGYLRIIEHPEYLLFGAGEGVTSRFTKDREFHSSFGVLIFCYGLVGMYLIFEISRLLLVRLRWHTLVYAVPLVVYSLTHHGLRSPLLWLLLMLLILGDQLQATVPDAAKSERSPLDKQNETGIPVLEFSTTRLPR